MLGTKKTSIRVIAYQKKKIGRKIKFMMVFVSLFFVCLTGFFLPTTTGARSETYQGITYNEGTWIGPIGQEVDASGWSAARVIYQVSQWYGINPQTLLATLQKESSLVTYANPPFYLPMWAMGYAYTDSGIRDVCRTSTNNNPTGSCAGFAMQMDWAGGSLKFSQSHYTPGTALSVYDYQSGANTSIIPENGSTASLYRYTPYITRPNTFCTLFSAFGWSTGQNCQNPGNVINDDIFVNSGSMNEAQIQAFLVAHGSYLASYTVPSDNLINVYRFYNVNGTHFYTASESEKNNIIARWPGTYRYEGVSYTLNYDSGRNDAPLYRFYVPSSGTHFYTASAEERDNINARWGYKYQYEGGAYNVSLDPNNAMPVYRFLKTDGTHFYTAGEAERDNINARWGYLYRYEGIAYYIPN